MRMRASLVFSLYLFGNMTLAMAAPNLPQGGNDTVAPGAVLSAAVAARPANASAVRGVDRVAFPPDSPAPVLNVAGSREQVSAVPSVEATAAGSQELRLAPANDNCANAFEIDLAAGSSITVMGNNTGATLDCPILAGPTPWREVWFKITTHDQLDVTIDYCGTSPAFAIGHPLMMTSCPCALPFVGATSTNLAACGDGNQTMVWEGLPAGTYYWPLLTDSVLAYAEGPYTLHFAASGGDTCPDGALVGQPPAALGQPWGAFPSGFGPGREWTVFESFSVAARIAGVHWWGFRAYFDPNWGGWYPCDDPADLQFEITFFESDPNGLPGAAVATYVVTPTVVDLGAFWSTFHQYYYSVEDLTPCDELLSGWISVKTLPHPANCTFLWMSSPIGDSSAYLEDGGALSNTGRDVALCLVGGDCPDRSGACCLDWVPTCVDNVREFDCLTAGGRFSQGTLCDDLVPPCGEVTGACCHPDATCTITMHSDCADNWLGPNTTCDMCPCIVLPPAGSVLEEEPCGADTDGGCAGNPPTFAPLACGDTVYGTLWADFSLRDTDWYRVVTTEWYQFTWTAEGEVPMFINAVQAGPAGCADAIELGTASGDECQLVTVTTEAQAPGEYWFWVAPANWNDWPCDKHYTATLTCAPADPVYCPASGGCEEHIQRVQIGALDNSSACSPYQDFTYLSADVPYGGSMPLDVTNGEPYAADRCSVWVDWNHDFTFSADEVVGTFLGLGPYHFEVSPPVTATAGPARMRICIDYQSPGPQPCGPRQFGEVEDYTLNVVELPGACCLSDGSCQSVLPSECAGDYAGPFTICAANDCNGNGIDDACDIAGGFSADCNENGIPDECDIANCPPDDPSCADCQGNGVLDGCELAENTGGVAYQYDDGSSDNSFGLTAGGYLGWINGFVVKSGAEVVTKVSVAYGQVVAGTPTMVCVWSDPDQDGDPADAQVLTAVASAAVAVASDKFVTVAIPPTQIGAAGTRFFVGVIIQHADGEHPALIDQNVSAGQSWILSSPLDPIDPNNLGGAYTPPARMDSIGYPGNWLIRADVDEESDDCNLNSIPDECETDCNGNGIPDDCDLAAGTSRDLNGNAVPDECEGLGDVNCDGATDLGDINAFVLRLVDAPAYFNRYPDCPDAHCDINGNGVVGFDDINPFVDLLTGR